MLFITALIINYIYFIHETEMLAEILVIIYDLAEQYDRLIIQLIQLYLQILFKIIAVKDSTFEYP